MQKFLEKTPKILIKKNLTAKGFGNYTAKNSFKKFLNCRNFYKKNPTAKVSRKNLNNSLKIFPIPTVDIFRKKKLKKSLKKFSV